MAANTPPAIATSSPNRITRSSRASSSSSAARIASRNSISAISAPFRLDRAASGSSSSVAQPLQEARGLGAVDDPVVARERDVHQPPRDDRAVRRSRPAARATSPTARIAACGWLITAVKRRTPNMPRLETVNVPSASSSGAIERDRAPSRRAARDSSAISKTDLRVGVEDRRARAARRRSRRRCRR